VPVVEVRVLSRLVYRISAVSVCLLDHDLAGLQVNPLPTRRVADLLPRRLQPTLLLVHVPLGGIEQRVEAPLRHREPSLARPSIRPLRLMTRGYAEFMLFSRSKTDLVTPDRALPGRSDYAFSVPDLHFVTGRPIKPPFPQRTRTAVVGLGCFWGAERVFWETPGVWTTAVGYAGGYTPYPTYDEVCSGLTGHAEVVLVVFEPASLPFERLLQVFFEAHDPTQGMRQGNDVGTQYRSTIYVGDETELAMAEAVKAAYSTQLAGRGFGPATTEIATAGPFYYAEDYHQQYLAKNPNGYCGLGGTGVSCPVGLFSSGG
jgi:peptide-methionine (S)-S-oxide reductase